MIINNKKIYTIPATKLVYNPSLPRQNINIETLIKMSHSNIPSNLPLVSTTYTDDPKNENKIIILLSNILLKIRKLQNENKIPVVFYHQLKTQELLFLYTNYKKYNLINHIEEAIILHQLNKEGYTHKQIGSVLGVSRSYITNKIRFLTQPKELIEALLNNEITEGHAKLLMGLQDKITKLNLLEIVKTEHLSVKETSKLIQNFRGIKPQEKHIDKDVKKIIEQLNSKLKALNINYNLTTPKRRRQFIAKLQLTFKNKEELQLFLESLKQ